MFEIPQEETPLEDDLVVVTSTPIKMGQEEEVNVLSSRSSNANKPLSSRKESCIVHTHLPQITINKRASPSPPASSDVSKDLDTSLMFSASSSKSKTTKMKTHNLRRKKKKWSAPVPIDLPSESYFIKNGIGRVYAQRKNLK